MSEAESFTDELSFCLSFIFYQCTALGSRTVDGCQIRKFICFFVLLLLSGE